jgi:hypothetical protein
MVVVVLEGPTEDRVEEYLLFFQCFMVSITGRVRWFLPVDMVMDGGDATGAWYFSLVFYISDLYSQFCYIILCMR